MVDNKNKGTILIMQIYSSCSPCKVIYCSPKYVTGLVLKIYTYTLFISIMQKAIYFRMFAISSYSRYYIHKLCCRNKNGKGYCNNDDNINKDNNDQNHGLLKCHDFHDIHYSNVTRVSRNLKLPAAYLFLQGYIQKMRVCHGVFMIIDMMLPQAKWLIHWASVFISRTLISNNFSIL